MKIISSTRIILLLLIFYSISTDNLFAPWAQVEELWSQGVTPLDFDVGIHYGRYVSVYMGFLFEDLLPNYGFSYYISIWMIVNITMMNRIAIKILEEKPRIWFYLLIIGMHLNMNGRGVLLCSAWILCIWCLINIYNFSLLKSLLLLIASLWFGSASTGVFFVIFLTFFVFSLRSFLFGLDGANKARRFIYALLIFWMLLLGFDYLVSTVEKNLLYYGGDWDGLINMLDHGYGYLALDYSYIFVVIIALVSIFYLMYPKVKPKSKIKLNSELNYFIVIPILFGVFGYSVLVSAIFPLILRGHLIYSNFKF